MDRRQFLLGAGAAVVAPHLPAKELVRGLYPVVDMPVMARLSTPVFVRGSHLTLAQIRKIVDEIIEKHEKGIWTSAEELGNG